jgi:hypothetical protein
MAEDAVPENTPKPKKTAKKSDLADIVQEAKEKTDKPVKIQIPANFTATIKSLIEENKLQTDFLSKIHDKIEKFVKKQQKTTATSKKDSTNIITDEELRKALITLGASAKSKNEPDREDTTGEEAAEALKEIKPQPVIIKRIEPEVLNDLKKIFETLSISAKGKNEITQKGGGGDSDASSLFSSVFGKKLLPLASGLAAALALAVGSWFNDGPFKGLMKEFGKLGTMIFGKKLALEAAKLFPSLIKFIKPIARRLPIIGTIIDFGSAISRIKEGDFIGGVIDLASGVATLVPGIGTAISIGLGFLNAARDLTGQTEDSKKGEATKEGSILSILTQAVVKFAPKVLSKLKFLPVIGSLFSFASAFTNFKSGNIFKGLLDTVAGVAGFFPGAGTVVSLLASGVGLVIDMFGGEEGGKEDPAKAIDVPKSSGGSLLSRLTKYLSDKFKDLMKGTLNFLKKLPFVPDFIIDKVSKFLGLDSESGGQSDATPATPVAPTAPAPAAAQPQTRAAAAAASRPPVAPAVSAPQTRAAAAAASRPPVAPAVSAPQTRAAAAAVARPSVNAPGPAQSSTASSPEQALPSAAKTEPDWLQPAGIEPEAEDSTAAKSTSVFSQIKSSSNDVAMRAWAKQYKRNDVKTWKIKPKINSPLGYISAQKQNDEWARRYSSKELPGNEIPVKANEPTADMPGFMNTDPVQNKIPKGKTGGVFSGSKDGYLVEMHGTEAIVPLNSNSNETGNTESGKKVGDLTPDQISTAKQTIQPKNSKQKQPSKDVVKILTQLKEDYLQEDNKDRFEPKLWAELNNNLKWFEKQIKARKELSEDMKQTLWNNYVTAGDRIMGKDKSAQRQAIAFTKETTEKLQYKNNPFNIYEEVETSIPSTKARFGGVYSGPEEGYDMTLHGTEAVIPLKPDTKSKLPLESPLSKLPGMPGSELVEKIEILIETLKNNNNQSQVIDNSTVAGVNTITGGSTTTNIFQNSSERDIPYIERNKYRHKLIYSRGLI